MRLSLLFLSAVLCYGLSSAARQKSDCDKVLDTEPYFVKNKSGAKDQSLIRDIEILKRCGNFNATDSAFLKGPILGVLMLEQVNAGKPATYRTIVDFFSEFRKTNKYKDFEYGLSLYKKIGQKRIDLKNWDTDQELFVRMGFTVNDLNDFKAFMSQPEHAGLTYMAALTKYMTEIEAMSADK